MPKIKNPGYICSLHTHTHTHTHIYIYIYTHIYIYIYIYKSRRYPVQTITDADYADEIALLANAPAQAEILLYSLERAAASIDLNVNADKTKDMCFNQRGHISTQNSSSMKLEDKFTFLGSSVLSTETDINTWLARAWIAIYRLSVVWKPVLTDKIKGSFFQAAVVSILLYGCTT